MISRVRIHSDGAVAHGVGNETSAFTIHRDIFFRDRYDPATRGGDSLLAHELAHVVQTDTAKDDPALAGSSVETLESEADRVASAAYRNSPPPHIVGVARSIAPLRAGPDVLQGDSSKSGAVASNSERDENTSERPIKYEGDENGGTYTFFWIGKQDGAIHLSELAYNGNPLDLLSRLDRADLPPGWREKFITAIETNMWYRGMIEHLETYVNAYAEYISTLGDKPEPPNTPFVSPWPPPRDWSGLYLLPGAATYRWRQ
jgi:hypothetical protein